MNNLFNHDLTQKPTGIKYVITGVDRNNKRFVIETETPQHYNIWKGTLWKLDENGKRKKVKSYFN